MTALKSADTYRDPRASIDVRIRDLLAKMTLEEKVAQLGSRWSFELLDGDRFSIDCAASLLAQGIGQVTRVSGATLLDERAAATAANAIQQHLINETRLGIPAIIHEEICSGLMAWGSTVFPQAIGVASTWDPNLNEALGDAIRMDMRMRGAHQGLGPVLDIARDARWGRMEETFGEDPHVVAEMGTAFIRGLQGANLREGVIATAKHFVGYGASEGGMNWAPATLSLREALESYYHPFEAAVRAGVRSVMHAYVEVDGVPCAASVDLLTSMLRERWGFSGFVVSDYFALRQLIDYHGFAADAEAAAAMAAEAGVDLELPSTDCYGKPLRDAVASGAIPETTIEVIVARVLRAKFELGLFEHPFVDTPSRRRLRSSASRSEALARDIARKSIVLLRNDGVLPIRRAGISVAVIGPNADEARHLFGDYTYAAHIELLREAQKGSENVFAIPIDDGFSLKGERPPVPTILDALRQQLGNSVAFARGCDVNGTSRDGFPAAVELAAKSDLAVLVMGDKSGLTKDCTSGESNDRVSLDLPGVQEDLVREIVATGTPVVLVLVAGRPTGSAWIHERSAAVVMAWLPGQEGAHALADVLLGKINPSGKLPISFPRSVGQIPIYYGHKASGGRSHWRGGYVDSPATPLYPFGHGLSYTTFTLRDAEVDTSDLTGNDPIRTSVKVQNTGDLAGAEVVQLYIRRHGASFTRPVLELKGFARVELEPGEAMRVRFEVPIGQTGFYDRNLTYVVEPGALEILLGTSSADARSAGLVSLAPDLRAPSAQKGFSSSVRTEQA